MAVTSLPTIRTVISGDGVTSFDKNIQFTLGEKLESTYILKSTDSPITINYSAVSNLKSFIFYSDSNFTVNVSIDVGTTETPNIVVVPISVTNMFRFDPDSTLLGKISNVTISTTSTTNITISTFIYGVAS